MIKILRLLFFQELTKSLRFECLSLKDEYLEKSWEELNSRDKIHFLTNRQ